MEYIRLTTHQDEEIVIFVKHLVSLSKAKINKDERTLIETVCSDSECAWHVKESITEILDTLSIIEANQEE